MKFKPSGYTLKVGDVVRVMVGSTPFRNDKVTRVTKTMAICEKEGYSKPVRYPRVVSAGFSALPYQRSTIRYGVIDNDK